MQSHADADDIYELHASICKVFANPWRLRIVEELGESERAVSDLVEALGIPKSNVSQHLGIMREKGVVTHRRTGGRVVYRLSNPKTLAACRLMREVLVEHLARQQALAEQASVRPSPMTQTKEVANA